MDGSILKSEPNNGCHSPWFCHNPTMMKTIVELLQATVLAALFFGPLFYYFLFVMQP
jgi:hypothetical protein